MKFLEDLNVFLSHDTRDVLLKELGGRAPARFHGDLPTMMLQSAPLEAVKQNRKVVIFLNMGK